MCVHVSTDTRRTLVTAQSNSGLGLGRGSSSRVRYNNSVN